MLTWTVAFLGIITSFIVKFLNRKNKDKALDPVFWLKDNIFECIASFGFMLILLIIGSQIEFDDTDLITKIPFVKGLPLNLIFAAVAGYYNNVLWYAAVNKAKGK